MDVWWGDVARVEEAAGRFGLGGSLGGGRPPVRVCGARNLGHPESHPSWSPPAGFLAPFASLRADAFVVSSPLLPLIYMCTYPSIPPSS